MLCSRLAFHFLFGNFARNTNRFQLLFLTCKFMSDDLQIICNSKSCFKKRKIVVKLIKCMKLQAIRKHQQCLSWQTWFGLFKVHWFFEQMNFALSHSCRMQTFANKRSMELHQFCSTYWYEDYACFIETFVQNFLPRAILLRVQVLHLYKCLQKIN